MSERQSLIAEQIKRLDDSSASPEVKLDASRTLVSAGKDAIGPLIARLEQPDDPVFLESMEVDTGPMNAGPPAAVPVSVKFQVERLLYQIVYPDDFPGLKARPPQNPPPGALANLQAKFDVGRDALTSEDVSRPPLAFIDDWQSWWVAHQGESLDDIRKWARREVDRIWRQIHRDTTLPPN